MQFPHQVSLTFVVCCSFSLSVNDQMITLIQISTRPRTIKVAVRTHAVCKFLSFVKKIIRVAIYGSLGKSYFRDEYECSVKRGGKNVALHSRSNFSSHPVRNWKKARKEGNSGKVWPAITINRSQVAFSNNAYLRPCGIHFRIIEEISWRTSAIRRNIRARFPD